VKVPLLAVLVVVATAGCGSLSGLDAGSSFGCKAPDGISCQSVSGTYANAAADNLPSQHTKARAQADQQTAYGPAEPLRTPRPAGDADSTLNRPAQYAIISPGSMGALDSGPPLRSPEHVIRVWVAPYQDADGLLHDQSYIYSTVTPGKWLIEHNNAAIRSKYQNVRALNPKEAEAAEPPGTQTNTYGAAQTSTGTNQPVANTASAPFSLAQPAAKN
jgi:conjugal transfer pilus assembly protein TraV